MTKARAITLLALAGLLVFALLRRGGPPPAPRDAIYRMLDAARAGDVEAYLGQYAGGMEAALKQTVAENGARAFSNYLKATNGEIKGVAISELRPASGREAALRVEYVYADRNEVQNVYLEKLKGRWKIARVDAAERVKTLVPYGAPVE
jgi:hypothetical protein